MKTSNEGMKHGEHKQAWQAVCEERAVHFLDSWELRVHAGRNLS